MFTEYSSHSGNHYSAEWVLASELKKNPMLWFVEVNGLVVDARTLPLEAQIYCAERGLIPYVPGLYLSAGCRSDVRQNSFHVR